jgi:hypothetical protein
MPETSQPLPRTSPLQTQQVIPEQPVQFQISHVDNGYIIVALTLDGFRKNTRRVATTEDDLRKQMHELVDQIYVQDKPVETPPSGPAGPESLTGT